MYKTGKRTPNWIFFQNVMNIYYSFFLRNNHVLAADKWFINSFHAIFNIQVIKQKKHKSIHFKRYCALSSMQSYLSVLRTQQRWLGLHQAMQGWIWFSHKPDRLSGSRGLLVRGDGSSQSYWWGSRSSRLCIRYDGVDFSRSNWKGHSQFRLPKSPENIPTSSGWLFFFLNIL